MGVLLRNILTFHKYDTDGSGQLDFVEFGSALRDLGYPAARTPWTNRIGTCLIDLPCVTLQRQLVCNSSQIGMPFLVNLLQVAESDVNLIMEEVNICHCLAVVVLVIAEQVSQNSPQQNTCIEILTFTTS